MPRLFPPFSALKHSFRYFLLKNCTAPCAQLAPSLKFLQSQRHFFLLKIFDVFYCFRISGNAASNKNIHGTVSEQLRKNFAKSRWKVLLFCVWYCNGVMDGLIKFQQAYHATAVIRQMQRMALNSGSNGSGGRRSPVAHCSRSADEPACSRVNGTQHK